ncbi:uncharacterized protein K452DRAFT_120985 [Aplosporella prunicola CBS 121167]|uniref:MT-A70-domain-containing protein n=1 Tax=Aplosporella prunicola CBS 121167 TaxID=1176127 RepID=A0A6A6BSF5_9PEZI|nr:uncharacterized protein K452DRAFT_120985 [Aplosporella prunicola CBS 121167]KAF2145511.1 hypothetical protein K452DRAFT_120985 [Aplosporella prunicola CBS 121167]
MDSILYQNAERTVTVIDIPTSIAEAQGTKDHPHRAELLSLPPPKVPYRGPGAKSEKAKRRVANLFDEKIDAAYRALVTEALEDINSKHTGNWFLPRKELPPVEPLQKSKKRKAWQLYLPESSTEVGETNETVSIPGTTDVALVPKLPQDFFPSLLKNAGKFVQREKRIVSDEDLEEPECPFDTLYHNPDDRLVTLSITHQRNSLQKTYSFNIPPGSTFLLSDCKHTTDFRNSIRCMSQEHDTPKRFDFILLDPPWPNSSAKNKNTYNTTRDLSEMSRLLLKMELDAYINPNGIIGVWITNRPSVRDLVLDPENGLFASWNITLCEEWVWLKTLHNGEPVLSLDHNLRKPYEVLLLGRRPENQYEWATPLNHVKRRVIAAVPDLHSRKPCVKRLVGDLLEEGYSAMEIFGRYCVAGWWTWGNEAIKYNWEEFWVGQEAEKQAGSCREAERNGGEAGVDERATIDEEPVARACDEA